MPSIYDVPQNELIEKVAEELKKKPEIKPPVWAPFVKTGVHKERVPVSRDWWYIRTAAVLRSVYKIGPVGVSKLRTRYGGKKNRGVKTEHFYRGSGNILRKALQQLETAGLVSKATAEKKGRVVTPKGQAMLHRVALGIFKKNGINRGPAQEKA